MGVAVPKHGPPRGGCSPRRFDALTQRAVPVLWLHLAPILGWLVSDQRINQPFVGHWCHLFDPGFLNRPEVELEISSDSPVEHSDLGTLKMIKDPGDLVSFRFCDTLSFHFFQGSQQPPEAFQLGPGSQQIWIPQRQVDSSCGWWNLITKSPSSH